MTVPIAVNFYIVALQLLRGELLNVDLFMNMFAKTFLALIGPLPEVNAIVEGAPVLLIASMSLSAFVGLGDFGTQRRLAE